MLSDILCSVWENTRMVPEERSAELWPRTGLLAGVVDTGRRSRRVQWEGLLVPRTECNSALESQRQWCATSPGTANIQENKSINKENGSSPLLCSDNMSHIAASSNTSKLREAMEAELTRLQSTLCLLVAKVTGTEEDYVLNCGGH